MALFRSPFGTFSGRFGFSDGYPKGHPMEPASLDSTHNRTGSLENPEVLENVPGHVIPILEQEFDDFDTESTRFLKGQLEDDEFTKFRLKQAVYGQRQHDVQMVR